MGKAAKGNRVVIHLECTTCRKAETAGVSRYSTVKNRRKTTGRIELKKYCRFEKKHTVHKETK